MYILHVMLYTFINVNALYICFNIIFGIEIALINRNKKYASFSEMKSEVDN